MKCFLIALFIYGAFNREQCKNTLEEDGFRLKMVNIIFRHGRRTPILNKFIIKNTTWDRWIVEEDLPHTQFGYSLITLHGSTNRPPTIMDDFYTNMGPLQGGASRGKLTVHGQLDSYRLGKLIRHLYLDSCRLGIEHYANELIRLYSTNYDRTIKSMRCALAGMFPDDSAKDAILYTVSHDKEISHPNYRFCQKYNRIHDSFVASVNLDEEQASNRKSLARILEIDEEMLPPVSQIWEEINVLKSHGIELPPIFEENYELIEQYALSYFDYCYLHDRESITFGCGLFITKMYDYLNSSYNGTSSELLHLNSIHDTTILCLLKLFGVKATKWPDFSSYVAIELLVDRKDSPYIKIIHNNSILELEKNTPVIPLKRFREIIDPYLVFHQSFDKLCSHT